ncbi:MAG: MerR family transcriptional regulator [Betaproteobacteria bacterium]|nr:MerR family transcriptional regulator [Betaproteobacteria bacterium]
MHETITTYLRGQVVEEELHLTLTELCQACGMAEEHVTTWVFEGVLEPFGQLPQDWQFSGPSLRRARLALRLARDLEINPAGVALALDLLDQITELRTRLGRSGKS